MEPIASSRANDRENPAASFFPNVHISPLLRTLRSSNPLPQSLHDRRNAEDRKRIAAEMYRLETMLPRLGTGNGRQLRARELQIAPELLESERYFVCGGDDDPAGRVATWRGVSEKCPQAVHRDDHPAEGR